MLVCRSCSGRPCLRESLRERRRRLRQSSSSVISLDGRWLLATDPANQGVEQAWFKQPVAEAQETAVPWIIQDAFPGYHGVAWYWRDFQAPANPHAQGRYLLRFWAVDYKADVWLNGIPVGSHEGGETPFTLDVTDSIRPQARRIGWPCASSIPRTTRIDGIVLGETPHRNKALPYSAGSSYNHGGIVDSVELLVVPACYVTDLVRAPRCQDRPHPRVGEGPQQPGSRCRWPAGAERGAGSDRQHGGRVGPDSATRAAVNRSVDAELVVEGHQLWDLNEPNLYRVTARVCEPASASLDEMTVRCGFRDFRFDNGYFRLNGRRHVPALFAHREPLPGRTAVPSRSGHVPARSAERQSHGLQLRFASLPAWPLAISSICATKSACWCTKSTTAAGCWAIRRRWRNAMIVR